MIEIKVKSLLDTTLNTGYKEYNVSKGQVFLCELKNQEVLNEMVKIGILEVVSPDTPDQKPLPVFLPDPEVVKVTLFDREGNQIPLSGGLNLF